VQALRSSQHSTDPRVSIFPGTIDALQNVLQDGAKVLHINGHGVADTKKSSEYIAFEGACGDAVLVGTKQMEDLVKTARRAWDTKRRFSHRHSGDLASGSQPLAKHQRGSAGEGSGLGSGESHSDAMWTSGLDR